MTKAVRMTPLTRRQLLSASAGGLAIALIEPASSPALATSHAPYALLPDGGLRPFSIAVSQSSTLRTFSADFGTCYDVTLPFAVVLTSDTEIPPGSRATLSFDARVFEVSTPISALDYDGPTSERPTESSVDESVARGNTQTVKFNIDRAIGQGDDGVVVTLPVSPKPLYPSENVGVVEPVVLTVAAPDGSRSVSQSLTGDPVINIVSVWGAEMSGGWSTISVIEGDKKRDYRYPSLVRVTSVGPEAIPAGGVVVVDVDDGIVGSLTVESVLLNGSPLRKDVSFAASKSTTGSAARTRLVFTDELPASSVLEVFLLAEKRLGTIRVDGLTVARARFAAPGTKERPQRLTRRDTLTDLTPSGSASTPAGATGTV